MKKTILVLTLAMLSLLVFAQESRRSASTLGMFSSYTDDISASDIYAIDSSFASLGYSGSAHPMIAAGFAISPTMYLGAIGNFDLADSSSEADPVTLKTYSSSFDFTLALGINNNMGFHYNITRSGTNTTITDADGEEKSKTADWTHELAFSMKTESGLKFTIPVKYSYNLDKDIIDKTDNSVNNGPTFTLDPLNPPADPITVLGSDMLLSVTPSLLIPMDKGVMTELEIYAMAQFTLATNLNEIDEDVGGTKTTRDANKGYMNNAFSAGIAPTLEWKNSDEKLSFKSKPALALGVVLASTGEEQSEFENGVENTPSFAEAIKVTAVVPIIALPVGVICNPTDWAELRFGASYSIAWGFTTTEVSSDEITAYTNSSIAELAAGVGFELAEDFLLDLDLSVTSFSADTTASIQLTYKF